MTERIEQITKQTDEYFDDLSIEFSRQVWMEKFAELIVKETLDAVAERAYYTGDRDWSDELDRPWIQLEFGLGPLADAQRKAGIR